MPFTYDYECECGNTWEERRHADRREDPAECSDCGKLGKVVFSARGQTVAIPRRFHNGVTKAEVME